MLLIAAVVGLAATVGCSSPSPAPQPEAEQTEQETVEPTVEKETEPSVTLPDGYPQVVEISTLPTHMQDAFSKAGTGQAVAIAEGVWAELPPGATADDAVNAKIFSGFCASKEAFEREYLDGESTAGTCW